MRATLLLATGLIVLPTLAGAQGARVWTTAPVPGTGTSQGAPADRAGTATSADLGAPFSATPSGAVSGAGRSGPAPTTGTTSSTATVTPNLSK